jgi:hypothetical protein
MSVDGKSDAEPEVVTARDPELEQYENLLMPLDKRELFMEESILFRHFGQRMRSRLLL